MQRRNKFARIPEVPRASKRRYYRINHYIKVPKVRVVGREGKHLGVMSISQALTEAKEAGLDLVEVAPKADPPVCKILNFRTFIYEKRAKRQKERRGKKRGGGGVKEIRLRPFVSEHDLNVRLERIKEFLDEKNNVRITVLFRGREMRHKEFGIKLADQKISFQENKNYQNWEDNQTSPAG